MNLQSYGKLPVHCVTRWNHLMIKFNQRKCVHSLEPQSIKTHVKQSQRDWSGPSSTQRDLACLCVTLRGSAWFSLQKNSNMGYTQPWLCFGLYIFLLKIRWFCGAQNFGTEFLKFSFWLLSIVFLTLTLFFSATSWNYNSIIQSFWWASTDCFCESYLPWRLVQ